MEDENETKIEVPKKDEVNIESAESENGDGRIEIPVTDSPVDPSPAQPAAEKADDGMEEISLAPQAEPQASEDPVQPSSQESIEPPKADEQPIELTPVVQEERTEQQEPMQQEAQGEPEPQQVTEPVQEQSTTEPTQVEAIEEPALVQEQPITQAVPETKDSEPALVQVEEPIQQQRELAGEQKGIEFVEGSAPSPKDSEARELTGNDAFTPVQAPPSEDLPDVHKRWATRDALPAGVEPGKPRELSHEEQVHEAIRLHQENNKPKGFLARIRKIIGW